MEQKKKPELVLARPDQFEDLMALVKKISGRDPSPEERAEAKVKFDALQEKVRQLQQK
jgi:hypothetical protein